MWEIASLPRQFPGLVKRCEKHERWDPRAGKIEACDEDSVGRFALHFCFLFLDVQIGVSTGLPVLALHGLGTTQPTTAENEACFARAASAYEARDASGAAKALMPPGTPLTAPCYRETLEGSFSAVSISESKLLSLRS